MIGEDVLRGINDLFRRRVPQILGVYLAAGWAMLEFTDWLVNRYALSPHLIDLGLVAWALMIPTVLILAYYHGAPGRDRWTRVETIGVPLNVLVAAIVLVVVFAGRELGAVTRSVTVEDETGATVEREIPKSEFRKSLAILHFDNATEDDSLDWLQYGIPLALQFDLSQDYFIDFRYHPHFSQRLKEEGYADGTGVPLTLKRDIAEHLHMDHFVTGTLKRADGALRVDLTLYNTRSGKPIGEHSYALSDPLELTDRISVQLKQDLGIPEQHVEEAEDLPVAELLTTSPDAFRSFVEAYREAYVEGDWAGAVPPLEAAVSTDPGFAAAHLERFQAYTLINDIAKGTEALETAMRQLYRLPERIGLVVKTQYYWLVKQDIEKAKATAAMHTELLPEDAAAHVQLATFHQLQREYDRAVAGYMRALDLDPGQVELLLRIAELHRGSGDLDSALAYHRRYTDESPRDPRGFTALGDLYRLMGDHAQAREAYERALLLEGDHVPALVRLARLEVNLGQFPAAERHFQEALEASTTAAQRALVFEGLMTYERRRGHPNRAIEHMHSRWSELEASQPPFAVLQFKLGELGLYVLAGRAQAARDSLEAIGARLSPPFDVLTAFGEASIYLEMEEPDSLESALPGLTNLIERLGLESQLRGLAVFAEGQVYEWRGACDQAVINYERALEIQPESRGFHIALGRCYRKLDQLRRAEEHLLRYLEVVPYHPEARYELALVYQGFGKLEEALDHLGVALEVWSDAEPGFEPAREAREKMRELGGT